MGVPEQLNWKRESLSALITVLSLVLVGFLDSSYATRPFLPGVNTFHLLVALDTAACAYFWVEFLAGWRRALDRRAFALARGLEMLGAIPALLPLRWLRAVRLLRLTRFLRLGAITLRMWCAWGSALTTKPLYALAFASLALVGLGSAAFYYAEYGVNSEVRSFLDAVWLTITSITTVGFGDLYPASTAGRIVGLVVFIIGIGIFSSLTAAIAGFIVREPDPGGPDLTEITRKLDRLEQMLLELRSIAQASEADI